MPPLSQPINLRTYHQKLIRVPCTNILITFREEPVFLLKTAATCSAVLNLYKIMEIGSMAEKRQDEAENSADLHLFLMIAFIHQPSRKILNTETISSIF